jgi:pimeloyl-ACP methyl ester carboxylesterase
MFVTANGIKLAFDSFGRNTSPPILLIAGLGAQMIRWTETFCTRLASRGFWVIRFDNRDSGQSTFISSGGTPDFKAIMVGGKTAVPYSLNDMAADTKGLLDSLGLERAHLVGRSMGGLIAQVMAYTFPERVLSLTSIMASSGSAALPPPAPDIMAMLMKPSPSPLIDETAYIQRRLAFARRVASPNQIFDESQKRTQIAEELQRGWEAGAFSRQLAAIAVGGDRRSQLASISGPALVIHGRDDPLFPLPHGQDTASAIPSAVFMPIDNMGHDLPAAFHDLVIDAIAHLCSGHSNAPR